MAARRLSANQGLANRKFSIFPDRSLSYDLQNHGFEGERKESITSQNWRRAAEYNAPLEKSPTDVTLEELDLELGDVSHRRTKYGRKQSTPWKTLKPFRPASRDGKIPINKAGLFSFLFMSWMSPLIWRMFRKRKQDLEEGDIWQCSDLETCLPNTQRLTRIWEKDLKTHGPEKASFFRVWLKFSLTRTLFTLVFVAVNAVSTFLESGYLLNLVISYLEEPGFDLGYGLTLVAIIAVCQIIRATSFCLIIMIGIQTGVRFRAGYLGIAYNKVLRLKNLKGKALSEMVTLFGADAYRVYLNCVTFVYLLSLPVYMIIGVVYTYHLLGPWCFIAMGVFIFCYLIQAYLTNIVSSLRAKTLVYTDKRVRKVTEVLNSMKLIKMYAWEKPFRDAIHGIRKVERKFLFIASLVQSIMTAVIPVTPTLATVATLGAYKGFGNDIKASTAFAVSGSLYFLRIIVSYVPFSWRMLGESRVAFGRTKAFAVVGTLAFMRRIVAQMPLSLRLIGECRIAFRRMKAFSVVGTLTFMKTVVALIPFATRMVGECRVSFKRMEAFAVVGTLNFLRIIVAFIPFATRMIGECRVSFRRMEVTRRRMFRLILPV